MEKDINSVFSGIKKDLTNLLTTKIKIFKLDLYCKSSTVLSLLLYGLIAALVVFFACLFLCIALGLYIGDKVNSYALGMAIIGLIYLLVIAILVIFKKSIHDSLVNLFIKNITKSDDDDDDEDEN